MTAHYKTISQKRRVVMLCICIALGMTTTWLFAWIIALFVDSTVLDRAPSDRTYTRTHSEDSTTATVTWTKSWTKPQPATMGFAAIRIIAVDDEGAASVRRRLDQRTQLALSALPTEARQQFVVWIPEDAADRLRSWNDLDFASRVYSEFRYGWPMQSLVRFDDQTVASAGSRYVTTDQTGLDITDWLGWPEPMILPTRILAFGFAINSILAATIWAIPLVVYAELRKRRRMAGGMCPMCNYDLRGNLELGCQECGWRRDSA